MGRKWTDEQKKAWGEKMKALKAAKNAIQEEAANQGIPSGGSENGFAFTTHHPNMKLPETLEEANDPNSPGYSADIRPDIAKPEKKTAPEPVTTNASEQDMQTILKQALEAIATLATLTGQKNSPTGVNGAGKLTGTIEKYAMDPARYPDPSERLANEARLKRFGFKENYALRYEISSSEYTTIDNIRMREPKFILDLVRIVFDEETGIPTDGRYVEYRMIMHEDPDSALWVARENGLNVDDYDETTFLNEMRYLQMRDWLLECFYKPKSTSVTNKREMVINGKLVEYFEVSSESSAKIPFNQLENKL